MSKRYLLAIAATAMLVAGCGSSDDKQSDNRASQPSVAEQVIRDWSDALRAGDVDKAAGYFSLPSIVENGTPPVRLRTRKDVRDFNVALPCGAKLVRTSTSGRFTTAIFRLTGRPGPGGSNCGSGAGHIARTTFVIRDGKITQWRRVANSPQPSGRVI